MEKKELFRKKDLRIADIATLLYTNTTYISATLNSGLGMSFPRFVTSYRVRYAQEQMLRFPEINLSGIAEEAGFANVNSFFRAFKTEAHRVAGKAYFLKYFCIFMSAKTFRRT